MFTNHSCNPTSFDNSYDGCTSESISAQNIKKGEEITCNYTLEHYDDGLLPYNDNESSSDNKYEDEMFECGSKNFRGLILGFKI